MIYNSGNQDENFHPRFALSMGDPAGIGPEIALKAFENAWFRQTVMLIGDASVMHETAHRMGKNSEFTILEHPDDFRKDCINIIDCQKIRPDMYEMGSSQRICGDASYHYIKRAIEYAMNGVVDGVITNPINKKSFAMAGISYPGHTEMFADMTGTKEYSMLFLLKNVAVAHVTTHCSVRKAIDMISRETVLQNITLLNDALKELGFERPRIAVSGLNPHAGENGLFGDEEEVHIMPAIQSAQSLGIAASGPLPPDTVFMRSFRGEFDGIVSMLHDHGFVALKSMDFEHGVNITIGLPIVRTSVGHGTAFDIAGKFGSAHADSLLAAHDAAAKIYAARRMKR